MTPESEKESPDGSSTAADKKRMKPAIMSPSDNSATEPIGRAELGTSNDDCNIESSSVVCIALNFDRNIPTPNDATSTDLKLFATEHFS